MNVSRETSPSFLKKYKELVSSKNSFTEVGDVELFSLLVEAYRGFCLVVEDVAFDVVFNVLYRSGVRSFSALSDKKDGSPSGFLSPLKISKNAFSLYKNNLVDACVVVNKSYFNNGSCRRPIDEVFFTVCSGVGLGEVVNGAIAAGMSRVPLVVSPGTYAERGAVCDLFPQDSFFPVRIDFSFENDIKIYVFDVRSQITTRLLDKFVFKVSGGGGEVVSVSSLVTSMPVARLGLNYIVSGSGSKKTTLTSCDYAFYLKNKGLNCCVDVALEDIGVCCDGVFYVPPWFLTSKRGFGGEMNAVPAVLDNFSNISVGDYMIHEDFGVGKFSGIICDDNENDSFISLEYLDGMVSVAVDSLSVLSFYESADMKVSLNSISRRGSWKKRLSGVSKKINHFVSGLLSQHLARLSLHKDRGEVDEELLDSFLSAFKYKDTRDQLLAFNDIYSDLQSPEPMDRLLCGDVGFGKTEIALRAAFISLLMGGRVVVLAPTTILCYQLFNSFVSRLEDFSVGVKMVSRLAGGQSVKNSLELFNRGKVDVLVCTQRIFSHINDIDFLSLLIVDEEHRFGVQQKELFLKLFPNIDVLSMSATPIPRSLQQSFSGIKTISTIATPPVNRRPIQTSVIFFDLEKIVQNILFELKRGGQVYFLQNNISSINKIRRVLVDKISGLRVGVIHGKMVSKKIEDVLNLFVLGDCDVLISTSIIESGLDIPNVNTIIINNAHLFGLSQLHQIRGRVGRHNRQAFAYLLVPRAQQLNLTAKKRLKTIEENVSLGSGYNIASKDLDIRGAGSVFGYAQSGGSSVGFDLYNKLLSSSFSSGVACVVAEPRIDLFVVSPCFPSDYIKDEVLRLSLYKKLSNIKTQEGFLFFKKELVNRFGVRPAAVESLIKTQELKSLALRARVSSIFKDASSGFVSVIFLPGEHVLDVPVFLSFLNSFFENLGFGFSINKKSGNRVLVSFSCDLSDNDYCVVLMNLLNKFIGMFLKENK